MSEPDGRTQLLQELHRGGVLGWLNRAGALAAGLASLCIQVLFAAVILVCSLLMLALVGAVDALRWFQRKLRRAARQAIPDTSIRE